MSVFQTYSTRNKRQEFKNNKIISDTFRRQVNYILKDTLGEHWESWQAIYNRMCRKLGLSKLYEKGDNYFEICINFVLNSNSKNLLDIIEVSFNEVQKSHGKVGEYMLAKKFNVKRSAEDAIKELNLRFRENNLNYRFIDGKIIKVNHNKFAFEKFIKSTIKTLELLNNFFCR